MKPPQFLENAARRRAVRDRQAARAQTRAARTRTAPGEEGEAGPGAAVAEGGPGEVRPVPPVLLVVAAGVVSAALLAAMVAGTSVIDPLPDRRWLLAGVTWPVLVLVLRSWWRAGRLRPVGVATAAVVPLVVLLVGTFGATSSVVIDGEVRSAFSEEARVWRFSQQLQTDLATVAAYDELIRLSETEARSRYTEYASAVDELRRIQSTYATLEPHQLPTPAMSATVRTAAAAAFFGGNAAELRSQLVLRADAALAEELEQAHEAYVQQTLQAGRELGELAEAYGFDLRDTAEVVE